jgi:hypothetical protein
VNVSCSDVEIGMIPCSIRCLDWVLVPSYLKTCCKGLLAGGVLLACEKWDIFLSRNFLTMIIVRRSSTVKMKLTSLT